jgi:hypothetical protein
MWLLGLDLVGRVTCFLVREILGIKAVGERSIDSDSYQAITPERDQIDFKTRRD